MRKIRQKIILVIIIELSAKPSNEVGLGNLSLKLITEKVNIKSPSLYNHIKSLEEIKEKIMIYGWKQLKQEVITSAVGVSGNDAE